MASDSLKQVGKAIKTTRKNIGAATRDIARVEPIIERTMDTFGVLDTFKMEFYTYTDTPSVHLNIIFLPPVRNI